MFLGRYKTSQQIFGILRLSPIGSSYSSALPGFRTSRKYSQKPITTKNYYDVLKISQDASQAEIKNAYYDMSMLYHPDKNKGEVVAAQKFREITQAYEVLGNENTRQEYNKGLQRIGPSQDYKPDKEQLNRTVPNEEIDPVLRFYQQHARRSEVPTFDNQKDTQENIQHRQNYQRMLQKKQDEKKSDAERRMHKRLDERDGQLNGISITVMIFFGALFYGYGHFYGNDVDDDD